jgi:hypothetical protein
MHGAILHSPNAPSWHGAQLKQRDNFNIYLLHIVQQSHRMIVCDGLESFREKMAYFKAVPEFTWWE